MQEFPLETLHIIFSFLDIFQAKYLPLVCDKFNIVCKKLMCVWLNNKILTYQDNILPLSFIKQNKEYITSCGCHYTKELNKGIERVNLVLSLTKLKKLSITGSQFDTRCKAFTNLKYLDIYHDKYIIERNISWNDLNSFRLTTLKIGGSFNLDPGIFNHLTNLKTLYLHSLKNNILPSVISKLSSLKSLCLISKFKGGQDFHSLIKYGSWLTNFTNLTSLTTDYAMPSDSTQGLINLTHLGTFGNVIKTKNLAYLTKLKNLFMSNYWCMNLDELTTLTRLELLGTNILPSFRFMKCMTQLKQLRLEGIIGGVSDNQYKEFNMKCRKVQEKRKPTVYFFER